MRLVSELGAHWFALRTLSLIGATLLPVGHAGGAGGAFAEHELEPRCTGRYCGRPGNGTLQGSCGQCPRGWRTDGWVCRECAVGVAAYDVLFLGFNVFLITAASAAGILEASPGKSLSLGGSFSLDLGIIVRRHTSPGGCGSPGECVTSHYCTKI